MLDLLGTDELLAFCLAEHARFPEALSNPRPNVHVLLSLDETSYSAGSASMNGDHPIAWCHEYDGGRAFYTALGHAAESFSEPLFINQLAGAVAWVLAR